VDYFAAIELEIDRPKLVKTAFLYMRKNESHSGIQTNGIWILIAAMAADIDQKICIFDEGIHSIFRLFCFLSLFPFFSLLIPEAVSSL
jgi:hypothetical protein